MEGENKENKAAEVNLDALSSPEGTAPENFELFKSADPIVEKSNSQLYGLPNLDPEVKTEVEGDSSKPDPAADAANVDKAPEKPADTAAAPNTKSVEAKWFERPFKALQKRLGLTDEEFKIPEGLTEENYDEKYNEILWEHTEYDEAGKLHPELKKINDLVSKGMPYEEALGAYQQMNNLEKLSDKDLVALSLKQQFGVTDERKDGWDENKINERISKMDNSGYLEIEAQRLRDQIKSNKENINAEYEQRIKQTNEKQSREFEEARTRQINDSLELLSGMKEVFGIPVSKAELAEFKEDFKYLVTPNEKGQLPITEYLQSNENLVKFAYFLKKGDAKIREALTKAKENAKKSVIDKLDDTPQLPKKIAPYMNEAAIDLNKLDAPARY